MLSSTPSAGERLSRLADSIHEKLLDEEDARACRDIDESACREVPHNFSLLLLSQLATKLGDALASPKTVLAWASAAVGAPAAVLGLLVPVRESGSLIPQLVIGGMVRRLSLRKWVWVAGSLLQGLCILLLGLTVLTLQGVAAGSVIVALVALFSLARGFCSVASKDVLGKTLPKGQRGQLTGWSASAAGCITLVVGGALLIWSGRPAASVLGLLIAGAGALWFAGAGLFALVREYPGETSGGGNAGAAALASLALLRDDVPFRNFVIARALLMCSALSAPFYVALGQGRPAEAGDSALALMLGFFVLADGLASLVSAPLWGRASDRSSRQVMAGAALITAFTGLMVFAVARLWPVLLDNAAFLPAAYFLLCVAHAGVRVGRKTYVVDLASGNKRTDYVAVSNSVIGVLLLLVGSLGALAPLLGYDGVIAVLAGGFLLTTVYLMFHAVRCSCRRKTQIPVPFERRRVPFQYRD